MRITKQVRYETKTKFIRFLWDNRKPDLDSVGLWCLKLFLRRASDSLGVAPLHEDGLQTYMPFHQDEKAEYANWVESQIEPFIKHCIGDAELFGFESLVQGFVRTILRKIGRRPRTFN